MLEDGGWRMEDEGWSSPLLRHANNVMMVWASVGIAKQNSVLEEDQPCVAAATGT